MRTLSILLIALAMAFGLVAPVMQASGTGPPTVENTDEHTYLISNNITAVEDLGAGNSAAPPTIAADGRGLSESLVSYSSCEPSSCVTSCLNVTLEQDPLIDRRGDPPAQLLWKLPTC